MRSLLAAAWASVLLLSLRGGAASIRGSRTYDWCTNMMEVCSGDNGDYHGARDRLGHWGSRPAGGAGQAEYANLAHAGGGYRGGPHWHGHRVRPGCRRDRWH